MMRVTLLIVMLLLLVGFNMGIESLIQPRTGTIDEEKAFALSKLLPKEQRGVPGNIDENSVEELAKVIAAENAGGGIDGMTSVAHTILNNSRHYGISPLEVSKKMYNGYTNVNKDKIYDGVREESTKIAEMLLMGKLGKDITNGARFIKQHDEALRNYHQTETYRDKNHIYYK